MIKFRLEFRLRCSSHKVRCCQAANRSSQIQQLCEITASMHAELVAVSLIMFLRHGRLYFSTRFHCTLALIRVCATLRRVSDDFLIPSIKLAPLIFFRHRSFSRLCPFSNSRMLFYCLSIPFFHASSLCASFLFLVARRSINPSISFTISNFFTTALHLNNILTQSILFYLLIIKYMQSPSPPVPP